MGYQIRGLDPTEFASHFAADERGLAERYARFEIAGKSGRYPCRVSLQDAQPGEKLLLINHVSHAVDTPYRSSFAIYVRESAAVAAEYVDETPPILRDRPIALRGYSAAGDLCRAALALADDVDRQTRGMLEDRQVAYIDAHNAMHGCWAARIERFGDQK